MSSKTREPRDAGAPAWGDEPPAASGAETSAGYGVWDADAQADGDEADIPAAPGDLAPAPDEPDEPYDEDDEGPRAARRSQLLFVGALCAWTAWAWIRWGFDPPPPGPAAAIGAGEGEPTSQEPPPTSRTGPDGGAPPPAVPTETTGGGPAAKAADGGPVADAAGPPAAEPLPHGRVIPAPPAPDWPSGFEPPKVVTYTVRNGGTLENVANLHKIYHHEIKALNPNTPFDKELPAGTKVVVYRAERAKPSASLGAPGDGRLEGGVPMPDGPGRILKMIPWKSWGTAHTVAVLDQVLRTWAETHPDALPILVGNLSAPTGGKLPPHATHQSGRDVDLGYPQKPGVEKEYNWRAIDARLLDPAMAWSLLEILAKTRAVEVVFIDRSIQKLLYDYAVETGRYTQRQLARWMEYPRPTGSGSPFIQHVRGHVDHLHVRVACHPDDRRCISRKK